MCVSLLEECKSKELMMISLLSHTLDNAVTFAHSSEEQLALILPSMPLINDGPGNCVFGVLLRFFT